MLCWFRSTTHLVNHHKYYFLDTLSQLKKDLTFPKWFLEKWSIWRISRIWGYRRPVHDSWTVRTPNRIPERSMKDFCKLVARFTRLKNAARSFSNSHTCSALVWLLRLIIDPDCLHFGLRFEVPPWYFVKYLEILKMRRTTFSLIRVVRILAHNLRC